MSSSLTPQEPKKPVAYSRDNYQTYKDYEQHMRIWETAMGVYMANSNSQEVTEDNFGDPTTPQEPTAQDELREKIRLFAHVHNYDERDTDILVQLIEAEATRRERAAEGRVLDELEKWSQSMPTTAHILHIASFIRNKRQALKE